MTPSRRSQKQAARSGDGLWAILACGALGLCLLAGVVTQATIGPFWNVGGKAGYGGVADAGGLRFGGANSARDVVALTEEEIRAGSILFVPVRGDQCQHNLFDNRSGQIWPSGYVSCDIALQRGSGEKSKGWSIARTEAIRGSFRWKQQAE